MPYSVYLQTLFFGFAHQKREVRSTLLLLKLSVQKDIMVSKKRSVKSQNKVCVCVRVQAQTRTQTHTPTHTQYVIHELDRKCSE